MTMTTMLAWQRLENEPRSSVHRYQMLQTITPLMNQIKKTNGLIMMVIVVEIVDDQTGRGRGRSPASMQYRDIPENTEEVPQVSKRTRHQVSSLMWVNVVLL